MSRKVCPDCCSGAYSSTYVGYVGRDENDVKCGQCGWSGKGYQLLEIEAMTFDKWVESQYLGIDEIHLAERAWDAALDSVSDKWQPIECAPRGSGMDGPSSVTHPDYVEPPKLLLATPEGVTVGRYDWYYHEGFGYGADGTSPWRSTDSGEEINPTHWMPVPPHPEKGHTK